MEAKNSIQYMHVLRFSFYEQPKKKKKLYKNAFIIDTGEHYFSVYMYGYILFAY